jgi:hypothetical protein
VTSAEIEIGTVNADGSDGEEGSRSKEEQDDTGEDVADGDVNVEVGMMDHMTVFGFEPFDGPTVAFILLCVFVRLFVGYLVPGIRESAVTTVRAEFAYMIGSV